MAADDRRDRRDNRSETSGTQRALIGAGLAVAAGATAFLLAKRSADSPGDGANISDAPDHTWRKGSARGDPNLIGRTVTIGRPRGELYHEWRDFTRFPRFMQNVEEVVATADGLSKWTIKAPAGTAVELVTRITDDQADRLIAWESTPESQIETNGRVEFIDAAPGRGTMVRLTMRYDPPGGAIGKGIAKLLQREPNIQARRDLRRFKQLMETGEISTNASPSGRSSENPAEAHI